MEKNEIHGPERVWTLINQQKTFSMVSKMVLLLNFTFLRL